MNTGDIFRSLNNENLAKAITELQKNAFNTFKYTETRKKGFFDELYEYNLKFLESDINDKLLEKVED